MSLCGKIMRHYFNRFYLYLIKEVYIPWKDEEFILSYPMPCHAIPSHPVPSCPGPFCFVLFHSLPSHPSTHQFLSLAAAWKRETAAAAPAALPAWLVSAGKLRMQGEGRNHDPVDFSRPPGASVYCPMSILL